MVYDLMEVIEDQHRPTLGVDCEPAAGQALARLHRRGDDLRCHPRLTAARLPQTGVDRRFDARKRETDLRRPSTPI